MCLLFHDRQAISIDFNESASEKNIWLYIVEAIVKMSSQYKCEVKGGHFYCLNGTNVVDGIYAPIGFDDDYASLAHTQTETNPWLQIDLGKSFCISAVKIWNRNLVGICKYF